MGKLSLQWEEERVSVVSRATLGNLGCPIPEDKAEEEGVVELLVPDLGGERD